MRHSTVSSGGRLGYADICRGDQPSQPPGNTAAQKQPPPTLIEPESQAKGDTRTGPQPCIAPSAVALQHDPPLSGLKRRLESLQSADAMARCSRQGESAGRASSAPLGCDVMAPCGE